MKTLIIVQYLKQFIYFCPVNRCDKAIIKDS